MKIPKIDLLFDSLEENRDLEVALVGSSEVLLNNKNGSLIDQHDIVIRCNRAPINAEYTGEKTDIRIINCHLITDVNNDETAELHTNIFSTYERDFVLKLKDEHVILKSRDKNLVLKNSVVIEHISCYNKFSKVDYSSLEKIAKYSNGSEPSCGLVGIFIALSYFRHVNVFGFNMETDSWMNHYFEKITPYGTTHCIDYEQESVRGLVKGGHITLIK